MKIACAIVLLLYFTIISSDSQTIMPKNSNQAREDYRAGTFAKIEDGSIKNVFKTTQARNNFECLTNCLAYPNCQSINFQSLGNPTHLCELSEDSLRRRTCLQRRPGYNYIYRVKDLTRNWTCKNGGQIADHDGCETCKCGKFNKKQFCDQWTTDISSCKDIYTKTSYRKNMAYTFNIDNKTTDIYCHLTDDICGGGGWTLVMKMDCSTAAQFGFNAPLWSNKESYNLTAGQTGFDNYQTKMPSYWTMPFNKLCVGFKVKSVINWVVIPYKASSLYDVIHDGKHRATRIGRSKWLSLIGPGALVQAYCNQEGFNNAKHRGWSRIGLMGNNENNCNTPDYAFGFGLNDNSFSCGNPHYVIPRSGYVMIQ